jgi:putative transposase
MGAQPCTPGIPTDEALSKKKTQKAIASTHPGTTAKQLIPNHSYSMDFMSDALVSGRKLRILKVMDDCTRESLAVCVTIQLPGKK